MFGGLFGGAIRYFLFQQTDSPQQAEGCFLKQRDKFDELAITNYNVRHS